jgi:hypothetical protein
MRYLANSSHCPAIGVVPSLAYLADFDSTRVIPAHLFQAIGAAMLNFAG